jgi:hypothetical protein
VDPLGKGGRLEHTRLDATGVDFTALMRDLGVHPNSWVGWDLREVHAQGISGTFAPLKIDGDLTAKTYTFGVYDRPANDRARERLFGFSQAQLASHFSVRPDALRFSDVHAPSGSTTPSASTSRTSSPTSTICRRSARCPSGVSFRPAPA